jgi:hypothetical protein
VPYSNTFQRRAYELHFEDLDEEILLQDQSSRKWHCLSGMSAAIFRVLTREMTVDEVYNSLDLEGKQRDLALETMRTLVDQRLIVVKRPLERTIPRRDLAAVIAASISSVPVLAAAQMGSCAGLGEACSGGNCCSGLTCALVCVPL